MMTFKQFIWLDALVRAGGALRYWQLDDEEPLRGRYWPEFTRLREAGLTYYAGRWNPYIITERGRIAHALQAAIYARQARGRKHAA